MKSEFERNVPALSQEMASQILANVFEAGEREPSKVPLEVLSSYVVYRKDRYGLQKTILMIVMLLFCTLPLFFYLPEVSVTRITDDSAAYPIYEMKVDTILPVLRVKALVNGRNTAVYETGEETYQIQPSENGDMDLEITLWNRQSIALTENVDGIDVKAPYLVSDNSDNGLLHLFVCDDGSGIDYASIYAETETGFRFEPIETDAQTGEIIFEMPKSSVNVFIKDYKDNTLQLVVTIR